MTLAVERTGRAGPLLLLLHGLGANLAVWDPLLAKASWPGRTLAVDLRGHGRSPGEGSFSLGTMAADVADLVADEPDLAVLGHSLGGACGVLLASGLFGLDVARLAVFGVKDRWDPALVQRLHALADSPVRTFGSAAEAAPRALAAAGLRDLVAEDSRVAVRAVRQYGTHWRVAAAPGTNRVAGQRVAALAAEVGCRFAVAHGSADPMVDAAEAAALGPVPRIVDGAGHQPHVTHPDALWAALQDVLLG